jgi:hypothetical protein
MGIDMVRLLKESFNNACSSDHFDLAICYLREIVRMDPVIKVPKNGNDNHVYRIAILARKYSRNRVMQVLREEGVSAESLETLDKVLISQWHRVKDHSDFAMDSFAFLFSHEFPEKEYLRNMTEEQYLYLLRNHRDILTLQRDLTIHRNKYFYETRLLAFAPEGEMGEHVDGVWYRKCLTYRSARLITTEHIDAILMSVPNLYNKQDVESDSSEDDDVHATEDDYVDVPDDDDLEYYGCPEDVWIDDKCRLRIWTSAVGMPYFGTIRASKWYDSKTMFGDLSAREFGTTSTISIMLPYMSRAVIRHVLTKFGPPPVAWFRLIENHWEFTPRNVRNVAFITGLEDWYEKQEWISVGDIMKRIEREYRRRQIESS